MTGPGNPQLPAWMENCMALFNAFVDAGIRDEFLAFENWALGLIGLRERPEFPDYSLPKRKVLYDMCLFRLHQLGLEQPVLLRDH